MDLHFKKPTQDELDHLMDGSVQLVITMPKGMIDYCLRCFRDYTGVNGAILGLLQRETNRIASLKCCLKDIPKDKRIANGRANAMKRWSGHVKMSKADLRTVYVNKPAKFRYERIPFVGRGLKLSEMICTGIDEMLKHPELLLKYRRYAAELNARNGGTAKVTKTALARMHEFCDAMQFPLSGLVGAILCYPLVDTTQPQSGGESTDNNKK